RFNFTRMTTREPSIDAQERLAAELADRYLIEDVLGRGASATVYLAQELRHGRRVALKVLHSALGAALGVERFQREIRTQARLHHPHILPLFDSGAAAGRLYYTMPYVEAGTLRDRLRRVGRLEVGQAVQLATEVASALAYAHALGVIHRDLKPENVMLSPTGQAILADFGIAYALDEESTDESGAITPSGRLTETGVTVGTPAYMSPEQAAGDEVLTGRSDQYALAALVFEMLSGTPPYTGPNARAILARKLTAPPPPLREVRPEIPPELEGVLLKALARYPSERFESMEHFAHAMSAAAGYRPTPIPTPVPAAREPARPPRRRRGYGPALALLAAAAVAAGAWALLRDRSVPAPAAAQDDRVLVVLPFKNLGDPADQYFADGLTEEITSRLASLSDLRVISRTSADQYRTTDKSLKEIGGELGAGYVLEGSVRWERADSGRGRVRVTPQLIQVSDDSHLWAEAYEVELTEVFRVQTDIAEQVTAALDLALRSPGRAALADAGTGSPEAYDFYLRGNEYAGRSYGRSDVAAAVDLYAKAVALDSGFALAQARLARAHAAMYWFYHDRSPARCEAARRAADAAVRLARELPETRTAQGYYEYWCHRAYEAALDHFEAALAAQPSSSELLTALGYVERRRGRWAEATARFAEALRYDPRSALHTLDLADTYMSTRNYAEAERLFDRAIQLAPDWAEPYAYKAMLYLVWQGDLRRARAVIGHALTRTSAGRLAQALSIPDAISASLLTADSGFAPALASADVAAFDGDTARYRLVLAEAARYRGQAVAAAAHADSAIGALTRRLALQPDDPKLLVRLGLALAMSGRNAPAIASGRRAVELLPVSADANSGPFIQTHLARIYTLVGEPELAIATLRPLLEVPCWITPAELEHDPLWAPLRSHPSFATLLTGGA
ncbi:MAG TPA: protein kinase, partial [Gemmatimonadales bacterium]|nr:protein kinase [Gemmatimonadales bacterium]